MSEVDRLANEYDLVVAHRYRIKNRIQHLKKHLDSDAMIYKLQQDQRSLTQCADQLRKQLNKLIEAS